MYLTHKSFLEKVDASGSSYWQEGKSYRWNYMGWCIEQLKQICPDDSKLIEAGTSGMPLSDKSYLYEYPMHNLNLTPFRTIEKIPIAGGQLIERHTYMNPKIFDCFVALQTWEHLDRPEAAFAEVMRISKNAILSFPLNWKHGDKRHKGITREKIASWTLNVKPEKEIEVNNRLICVWRF